MGGSPLADVTLHLVDSIDSVVAFRDWAGQRRETPIAFDTESSGLSPEKDRLRLIQLGDMHHGWAFTPEWHGAALEILRSYEGDLTAHNLSHDYRFLYRQAKLALPWHKLHDTLLLASLDDPMRSRGLKPLAKRLVDPSVDVWQKALDDGMKRMKWDWGSVPFEFGPYIWYSALDPVLTAHLWHQLHPRVVRDCPEAYDMELGVNRICTRMMLKGMQLDAGYVAQAREKLERYSREARIWLNEMYGITSVLSARQISSALTEHGEPPTARTATGLPKTDKEFLGRVQKFGKSEEAREIARQVLGVRHAEKMISAYLDNFTSRADADGVVRCSIWQAEAVTGRMCIPDSHRLLTNRGILRVEEIVTGDLTIDASGNWTPVRAVHRYPETETVIYTHDEIRLEATAEHRWVLSAEGKPDNRIVAPIGDARRKIHLTPTAPDFDFDAREIPLDGSDEVQFAALAGWLVSDGRCHEDGPGAGLKARIYQTEQKFYTECLRCIPEDALMYDCITNGKDHHEIRIRARWLRPRLAAAGLVPDPLLRTSETLLPWVQSLGDAELRAFLSAVWLADGTTSHPVNKSISCESRPLREALQYAGYRFGLRSRVTTEEPGEWSTKERLGVRFMTKGVTTRYLKREPGRSDVWCVSTDSGTFTAWDSGPYLTGNSVTDPALQTLSRDDRFIRGSFIPRPGNVFISCDYSQVEARLAAHFGNDPDMIQAFIDSDLGGPDFFTTIASQIFGRPIAKSDQERQLTKNVTYCTIFGGGLEKMAQTAGVKVQVMAPVKEGFDSRFPGLRYFMNDITRQAREEGECTGRPAVRSGMGRYLPVERGKEYVAANRKIQSEAAEVLKRAMLDLDAAGLGDYMVLPIHDEVLFDIPSGEAEEAKHVIGETMSELTRYRVPLTASAQILPERWAKA